MCGIQNRGIQDNNIHAKSLCEILPLCSYCGVISTKAVNALHDQYIALPENGVPQGEIVRSLKTASTLLVHIDVSLVDAIFHEIQHLSVLILIRSRNTGISEFLVAHGLSFRPEHVHHATQLRKIIGVQTWGWFLGRWCGMIAKL